MGYKNDVIKGFSWLAALRIVTRGLAFIRTPILARLLNPSQVGVFALATIVLSLVEIITETGINIFLIQKKENIDKYISTAWIVSIFRGVIIALVIFFSAPQISSFFNFEGAFPLIQLISIVPLIRGFINPSIAKFIKDLSFKKEFIYRTTIFFVEFTVSLVLAFLTQTSISLVWGLIAGAIFEVALSFFIAKPYPRFNFQLPLFQEILSRGKWLTATGILSYLYHNGDDLVVGKLLGSSSLGMYDYAYKISMLPITEVSDVITKATFPVFVKISDDKKRLRNAYLKSVLVVMALVIPMGIFFFLFPREIISIVFGDKWVSASEALRVLAIFGVIRALLLSITAPIYALDKQENLTVITFISLIGMGVTIIPFVTTWGMVGAGYSALLGSIVSIPFAFYYVKKLLF